MMRIKRGLKVVTYNGDEVVVRQRVKIFDDEGNLIKAPAIEVREKRRHDKEPLEEAKKRAEEALERRLREAERRLGEKIKNTSVEE